MEILPAELSTSNRNRPMEAIFGRLKGHRAVSLDPNSPPTSQPQLTKGPNKRLCSRLRGSPRTAVESGVGEEPGSSARRELGPTEWVGGRFASRVLDSSPGRGSGQRSSGVRLTGGRAFLQVAIKHFSCPHGHGRAAEKQSREAWEQNAESASA